MSGENDHEYQYLKKYELNFSKFLLDKEGNGRTLMGSLKSPTKVDQEIKKLL